MSIIDYFWIKCFCRKVGVDACGNSYYQGTDTDYLGRSKRYVIYAEKADPSSVPALWNAWLRYWKKDIPNADSEESRLHWQRAHIANMSGTVEAYFPVDSLRKNKKQHYVSWIPQ